MVFRLDARDAGECPVQVCHVGAESFLEPACAGQCHVLELVLDGVDSSDELGRVGFGEDRLDPFAPAGQDEPGAAVGAVPFVEPFKPLPRGRGPVVDAPRPAVARAGSADGLLGWGEQVHLDRDELPQLVQQVELGRLVPVIERVASDDVVVPGFGGGLVVLPVRPAPGLLHVDGLEVGDEVRVDELAAVVAVRGSGYGTGDAPRSRPRPGRGCGTRCCGRTRSRSTRSRSRPRSKCGRTRP